LFCYCVYRDKR